MLASRPTDPRTTSDVRRSTPVRVEHSIVIPVYGNEESLVDLLSELRGLHAALDGDLEVVFVVDGSPDRSYARLAELLPEQPFESQLIAHSRNFGAFAALRTGLRRARGRAIAAMAADLQEPPKLLLDFFAVLDADEADVVVGTRVSRADPWRSRVAAGMFWALYRRLIQRDMPAGGVDVFACNEQFRDEIIALDESHSSLVGLTYWLGFRRAEVEYERLPRHSGTSGWTFAKKVRYLSDSIYSFTDLPIRLLLGIGLFGVLVSVLVGTLVLIGRLAGLIDVPGYAATMIVISLFGALNLSALGVMGAYVWRGYENTKRRPEAVVMGARSFAARASTNH